MKSWYWYHPCLESTASFFIWSLYKMLTRELFVIYNNVTKMTEQQHAKFKQYHVYNLFIIFFCDNTIKCTYNYRFLNYNYPTIIEIILYWIWLFNSTWLIWLMFINIIGFIIERTGRAKSMRSIERHTVVIIYPI